MSVRQLVDDAAFMIEHGRHDGALALLCIAIGASSRKVFPPGTKSQINNDVMRDNEKFTRFLRGRLAKVGSDDDGTMGQGSLGTLGGEKDIADVVYQNYRCCVVHEGELPAYARISPPRGDGTRSISVNTGGEQNITFDIGLLIDAVVNARCNASEFGITHWDFVPLQGTDGEAFSAQLARDFATTEGRVDIFLAAAKRITPATIKAATDDELSGHFSRHFGYLGGALASYGLTDLNGNLQKRGFDMLREIANSFELVEFRP